MTRIIIVALVIAAIMSLHGSNGRAQLMLTGVGPGGTGTTIPACGTGALDFSDPCNSHWTVLLLAKF